ncbi:MAG: hypothetical protein SFU25_06535 [Candidatus Caenarcaniphilales bacterium]|nr:hypothetical protein [Candidatus Caenarcaniphilales bacterium]
MQKSIKTIGSSGQISLGKEFAGKSVLVEELEPGVWMIKTGEFIPDNECWLHTPKNKAKIDEGLEWAKTHPRKETKLEDIEKLIEDRIKDLEASE